MSDVLEKNASARADRVSGGYAAIAYLLTKEVGAPISRQRVWMWWSRRAHNGFPTGWKRETRSGGGVRRFYLDEVLTWYEAHYGTSGIPAPRVGTP